MKLKSFVKKKVEVETCLTLQVIRKFAHRVSVQPKSIDCLSDRHRHTNEGHEKVSDT
jgi:hypothetical protein